tara:strand:- start:5208 stop:6116 length:909 start_codon:yes stop_codon:yes gene_type:complete
MTQPGNIAFIGFGEAAMAFVRGWRKAGNPPAAMQITAYDLKTAHDDPVVRQSKLDDYASLAVDGTKSLQAALKDTDVIFSLVTADQAAAAAATVSEYLEQGSLYLDCNSCAPGTKRRSAARIEAAGGRYVDVAVMAPVYPKMHETPLLISGPHVAMALEVFNQLGMSPQIYEGDVGGASSVKMIRSIMMKGMEALFAECVLAGRRAGVDETVLASLDVTYPGFDFPFRAAYNFERMMRHGRRRAEEMKEVALTVEELGLPNGMSEATIKWQQLIGDLHVQAGDDNYQSRADALLARMNVTSK